MEHDGASAQGRPAIQFFPDDAQGAGADAFIGRSEVDDVRRVDDPKLLFVLLAGLAELLGDLGADRRRVPALRRPREELEDLTADLSRVLGSVPYAACGGNMRAEFHMPKAYKICGARGSEIARAPI